MHASNAFEESGVQGMEPLSRRRLSTLTKVSFVRSSASSAESPS